MDLDSVNYDCLVARVLNDRELVLNQGSDDGVSLGDKFLIFTLGDEITDPNTDESLGCLELIKGKGEVVHVQERLCTIRTYDFTTVSDLTNPITGETRKRKEYRKFQGAERGDFAREIESTF